MCQTLVDRSTPAAGGCQARRLYGYSGKGQDGGVLRPRSSAAGGPCGLWWGRLVCGASGPEVVSPTEGRAPRGSSSSRGALLPSELGHRLGFWVEGGAGVLGPSSVKGARFPASALAPPSGQFRGCRPARGVSRLQCRDVSGLGGSDGAEAVEACRREPWGEAPGIAFPFPPVPP
eukprot:CAMPEP_0174950786 /NCGR_PEP_ID=MMETSP1355-20121228/94512_1 /TAXON_ID=464990 /ORGANISM="Hemiselmis tepida, Strain CCMP443" /LENGTH=174 /DNA_ID=CAMNT_0016198421 /DNA_START=465 /DNA_END=987 /DNA_ORIENTATION=+